MLVYLGRGHRRYHLHPVSVSTRNAWEFQAVLRGQIAPLLARGQALHLASRRLWVFPPEARHGWAGSGKHAEVAVFHVMGVHPLLADAVRKQGVLTQALGNADISRLRHLSTLASQGLIAPNVAAPLIYQQIAAELTLLALRNVPLAALGDASAHDQRRVAMALAWYAEHLDEHPGAADLANAVAVSPAHLRRLLHRVRGQSPAQAMAELRLARASELLADHHLAIERLADACGYASHAAFSRAFAKRYGCAPSAWRAKRRVNG